MRRVACIVASAGLACGHSPEPREPAPFDRLGSARHAAPAGTAPPDTIPPPVRPVPDEVVALARATEALHARQERDHGEIVDALRALAEALPLVVQDGGERIQAIHAAADALESSPATSLGHADQVRIALDHARVLLAHAEPRSRWKTGEYAAAVGAFADAATSIDRDVPLLPQHAKVEAAFDALVRVFDAGLSVTEGTGPPSA